MQTQAFYQLNRLTTDAFAVLSDGEPIAHLFEVEDGGWRIDLILDRQQLPLPFPAGYSFDTFAEAIEWLGIVEVRVH